MRIDLHTHSDRSDGTTPPREVVAVASAAGLDVVALTDHDTAEGWDEAADAAQQQGVGFVPGMEISCKHAGHSVHLLGYLLDPTYPPLAEELSRILDGRDQRMPRVCAKLRELGIPIEEADVIARAGDAAAMGRPHIADTLVRMGEVRTREEAFDKYLSPKGLAYVERYAPPVEQVIGMVRDAGGVAVLAHPWGRNDNSDLQEAGLAALVECGLTGIEVDHQDHDARQRQQLRAIARNLDLLVTGSSDFHGAGKVDHDLGCNTTDPAQYERLLEAAAGASRVAGRRTPIVVEP